ncbi:hypothetical protein ACLKA7_015266 [Drosophila subpalustris]
MGAKVLELNLQQKVQEDQPGTWEPEYRAKPNLVRVDLCKPPVPRLTFVDGEVVSTVIQEQEADSIDSSLMAWLLDAA